MIPILIPTQKLIIKNVLVSRELPTRHSRKAPVLRNRQQTISIPCVLKWFNFKFPANKFLSVSSFFFFLTYAHYIS